MPHIPLCPVRSRSITRLGHISPDSLGKHVILQEAHTLGSKTSTDEEEEARRDDKEPVESTGRSRAVDEVADDSSANETDNDGDGDGGSGDVERDLL